MRNSMAICVLCCLLACENAHHPTTSPSTTVGRVKECGSVDKLCWDDQVSVYALTKCDNSEHLVINGAPDNVKGLSSAPDQIEPMLLKGTWVVLVFASYSIPDVACIPEAIHAAADLKGRANVAIRGFIEEEEIRRWCPTCAAKGDYGPTPLWVIFKDGSPIAMRRVLQERQHIVDWFEHTVPKANGTEANAHL